jgi:hypothetical protein
MIVIELINISIAFSIVIAIAIANAISYYI